MRHKTTQIICITLCLMLSVGLTACGTNTDGQTVNIAVAGPLDLMKGEYQNGIDMAVGEINDGYLDNSTVKVTYFDDKSDITTGIKIAQEIAGERDKYSAVIGHWNAAINIPAAGIYEKAKLVDITPVVSSVDLTASGKEYIFRNVPTDAEEAVRVAAYADEKGLDRIAICYKETDYGRELTKVFEDACHEKNIEIIDEHGEFIDQYDFNGQFDKWKALNVDAVFIADSLPGGTDLIKQIRKKDKNLTILSAGGFCFDDVVSLVGKKNSKNIAYASLFDPNDKDAGQVEFNKKFTEKYGEAPKTFLAMKGYEAVYLTADAIKETGSADSVEISKYLHEMGKWEGITDKYNFTQNGDPVGLELYIVEVKKGKYKYSL